MSAQTSITLASESWKIDTPLNKNLYQSILQTSIDGFWITDLQGQLLEVNRAYCLMSGYGEEELLTMNVADLEVSETATQTNEIKKQQQGSIQNQHRRKDGSTFSVEISRQYQPDNGGRLIGFIRDITERKRANEALAESTDRYKKIVENANDIIYRTDLDGYFTYVNPSAIKLLGYTEEEEALGEHFSKGVLPKYQKEMMVLYRNQKRKQIQNTYYEYIALTKDGSERWFGQNVQLIFDKGEAKGFQSVARDITERKQVEDALHESIKRFQASFSGAGIGMAIVSREHRIIEANQAFCEMLGYAEGSLTGITLNDITHPQDMELSRDCHLNLISGNVDNYHIEKRYLHKQGHEVYAQLSVSLVRDKDATPRYTIAHVQDITERKLVEDKVRTLSLSVEYSPNIVMITDKDEIIEYVNQMFTEITGYTSEEALGKNPISFLSHDITNIAYRESRGILNSGKVWSGEFLCKKKNGDVYLSSQKIFPIIDENGDISNVVSIHEDITESKKTSDQLSYQASHDSLTELINRREFERRAERLLSTSHQNHDEHALCYIDLDQFKIINDTCGHIAGDEMLRQLAKVLQNTVRKRDTLARLGGDEFGILMEHCSIDHAHRVTKTLQNVIRDFQFSWEEYNFKVGASMGLVAVNETISDVTELLKQADAACYRAKDLGRNRIHVYHSEDVEIAKTHGDMQWVVRLNQAIAEGWFCLYVQPIVSLDGSDKKHYEFLIRMVDDKGEISQPGAFLPAAERYNMITAIDRWVIKQAFSLLAENPVFQEQIEFCSINLSGQSITDNNFLDFIIKQFDESGLDGEKVCFEITETAAISNLSEANKFISTLKGLGCRFALDDFGSGLSSFAYLKNLPVDYLKIDGMFVKDIEEDDIDRAMVRSINDIGHVMGMQTIAEFVENKTIEGMLKDIGVDYAQGYSTGKPMAFEELLGAKMAVHH